MAEWRRTLNRLFARKVVLLAAVLLGLMLFMAVAGQWILPHEPMAMKVSLRLTAPNWTFWSGTDELGRDITSRIFYGARYSLAIGAGTAILSVVLGTLLGLLAGFFKRLDAVLMRCVDAMMAFPDILLGIALVSILGASPINVVLALTLVYTPRVARVVRACTLVIRELPYVEAARAVGVSTFNLLRVHILPNLMSPILVQLSFIFAYALLAEAGLSFLGEIGRAHV
jgi:peptide/nickel transport system permease protein